jgi:hypothetical protein
LFARDLIEYWAVDAGHFTSMFVLLIGCAISELANADEAKAKRVIAKLRLPRLDCEGEPSDDEYDATVDYCKANEEACKNNLGATCKLAWDSDSDSDSIKCARKVCNKICRKHWFSSWCEGLSPGAIAGIVIACVVVVVGAGVAVWWFVIRKKD